MRLFFLDDAGNSSPKSPDRYFGFGGFSIDAAELPELRRLQVKAWTEHPDLGELGDELKFAHVGIDKSRANAINPLHRIGWDRPRRRAFVLQNLENLGTLNTVEAIVSIVDKKYAFGADNKEHAIRVLLERIQLSAKGADEQYLVICDEEQVHQKLIRSVLHSQASWYLDYENVQETIMFAPSILSPGIQFADLVAGAAVRMLNYGDVGYFLKTIPFLRKSPWNSTQWKRYGFAVFPLGAWADLKDETGGLVPKTTGPVNPSQSRSM